MEKNAIKNVSTTIHLSDPVNGVTTKTPKIDNISIILSLFADLFSRMTYLRVCVRCLGDGGLGGSVPFRMYLFCHSDMFHVGIGRLFSPIVSTIVACVIFIKSEISK